MFIETSKDLLNLFLGISALLVAVMIAVLLYQFIMIIRDFRNLGKSIKEKITLVDGLIKNSQDILKTIKEKLDHSTAYIGILIELVTRIVDYMKIKRAPDKQDGPDDHESAGS